MGCFGWKLHKSLHFI